MVKITDASTYLDNHLTSNDYYAEGEQVVGRWCGRLSSRLGLVEGGEIRSGDRAFRLLRQNINPATNKTLTQRNVKNRISFLDYQCSAPKSVSLLSILAGDERLAVAHRLASAEAFAVLERLVACRVRAGDAAWSQNTRCTGNLCAANFHHDASRDLDPQLHNHYVVINATWDEKQQRMVALENCEMIRCIRCAGKIYQNALAREVLALGYDIEESRDAKGSIEGFEIRGVSAELRSRFSKRRKKIDEEIKQFEEAKGYSPSRKQIDSISRQTRSRKMTKISTAEVRRYQLGQLSAEEREALWVLMIAARQREARGEAEKREFYAERAVGAPEEAALRAAVAHLYERASVLRGHDVLAEALNTSLGKLDLEKLSQYIQAGGAGLVALDDDKNPLSRRFSTEEGIALEQWSVEFVDGGIGRFSPLFDDAVKIAEWLTPEQKEAVRFIGSSRDQVVAIRGVAGAGKTTMLKEVNGHLVAAGHRLLYLAPTAAAVEVLKSEGFANAMTVSTYLVRTESGQVPPAWEEAVVIVDEAGLSSNRQGAALFKTAKFANQRIVLVGDSRQHSSVDAGDFLRVLEVHSSINTRVLKDIRRQTVADYRHAIEMLACGQAATGMEQINRLGWVKEEKACYLEKAASEYLRLTAATSDSRGGVLCVAPTWRENHILTKHIRAGLRAAGKLGETRTIPVLEPLGWTTQQRTVLSNYRAGQVVTFNRQTHGFAKDESREIERIEPDCLVLKGNKRLETRLAASFDVARWREIELAVGDKILLRANRKKLGLINGNVLTIAAFGVDGSIQTAEGKTIPADYRHLVHGYAITSHKSQGRTTDHVVVAAQRLDSKAAYVACSRGRQSCTVFTPDREALFAGLPRSAERVAALDVLRARKLEHHRQTGRSDREGSGQTATAALSMDDHENSPPDRVQGISDQTTSHQEEPKKTNQEPHTYANTIRTGTTRAVRAIAGILRTIADAGRELIAGQRCLARATRSRRIAVRAIDRYRGRRSRGSATVRVELVQTLGRGLDHAGRPQGDLDQRQPDRLGCAGPGGCMERADARDRPGSEPAERGEAQPSTPEVSAASDLPTDLHRDTSEHADLSRKSRMGRRGR